MTVLTKVNSEHVITLTLALACITGLTVGMADLVPNNIRFPLLSSLSVVWFLLLTVSAAVCLVKGLSSSIRNGYSSLFFAIVAGASILTFSYVQLVFLHVINGDDSLSWGIDWRYYLNHVQAIAKYSDLSNSLDYHGAPITYHVGPAWLAAAIWTAFPSFKLSFVAFGLIYLLMIGTAVFAMGQFLHRFYLKKWPSYSIVLVTLLMPLYVSPWREFTDFISALGNNIANEELWVGSFNFINQENWLYSPNLMASSSLALTIGFSSMCLILQEQPSILCRVLGLVSFSSVVLIKPQYFVGFFLFLSTYSVIDLLPPKRLHQNRLILAPLITFSLACLYLAIGSTLPWASGEEYFSFPRFGFTGFTRFSLYFVLPSILLVLSIAHLTLYKNINQKRFLLVKGSLSASISIFVGIITLSFIELPQTEIAIERAHGVGWDLYNYLGRNINIAQSLQPILLINGLFVMALLFKLVKIDARQRYAISLILVLSMLAPLNMVLHHFKEPMDGQDSVDEKNLKNTLSKIPNRGTLLLSSDIADQDGDFQRPSRGMLLTSYYGHNFYVSNLSYMNYRRADSAARITNMSAFFGSTWSNWHGCWLLDKQITHVLTNDRCIPKWVGNNPLQVTHRYGNWTAWSRKNLTCSSIISTPPSFESMKPTYGQASCLQVSRVED